MNKITKGPSHGVYNWILKTRIINIQIYLSYLFKQISKILKI